MEVEKFLAIRRDDRFSPNSVERDRQILELTCEEIKRRVGLTADIPMIDEADLADCPTVADCYISCLLYTSPSPRDS